MRAVDARGRDPQIQAALDLSPVVSGDLDSSAGGLISGFLHSPQATARGFLNVHLRKPKDWSPADVALVRKAIDEISAKSAGKEILARAQRRGVTLLRRYSDTQVHEARRVG